MELKVVEKQGMLGLLALYVASGLGARYEEAQAWNDDWYAVYAPADGASEELIAIWRIRLRDEVAAKDLASALADRSLSFETMQQASAVVLTAATSDEILDADWLGDMTLGAGCKRRAASPSLTNAPAPR